MNEYLELECSDLDRISLADCWIMTVEVGCSSRFWELIKAAYFTGQTAAYQKNGTGER